MNPYRLLTATILMICAVFMGMAQDYHVRIGFIGNSITEGSGLPQPELQAYPIQLQPLLDEVYGDTCIVRNFGLTTTTMLKNGDVSYWDTQQLKDYLQYAPEVCFIMLGTNDTKPQNWDIHGDEFVSDYLDMIDTIRSRNPSTRFMLAYPPPAFQVKWGIRDSVIVYGVMPALDEVLDRVDADSIDFYHPLQDSVHLFPDFIHPGVEGAGVLAGMILQRIKETGLVHRADTGNTFITLFTSADALIVEGDSVELSWTTINADSLFLDGIKVPENGSVWVSPRDTTVYKLVAYGANNGDSAVLSQNVYVQELVRLGINPRQPRRDEGDTIEFKLTYYDQFSQMILNKTFDIEWEIIEGSGTLFGQTETSVFYVTGEPGVSTLEARYGEISVQATITTNAVDTGIEEDIRSVNIILVPNPTDGIFRIISPGTERKEVLITDQNGSLLSGWEFRDNQVDLSGLPGGVYIVTIHVADHVFSDKIIKL